MNYIPYRDRNLSLSRSPKVIRKPLSPMTLNILNFKWICQYNSNSFAKLSWALVWHSCGNWRALSSDFDSHDLRTTHWEGFGHLMVQVGRVCFIRPRFARGAEAFDRRGWPPCMDLLFDWILLLILFAEWYFSAQMSWQIINDFWGANAELLLSKIQYLSPFCNGLAQ